MNIHGTAGLWLGALLGSAALFVAAAPSASASYPERTAAVSAYNGVISDGSVESGWTGSVSGCDAGSESATSLASTLRTVNTLRSFAGVLPVTFDPEMNRDAMAAALMSRAAGDISHTPDSSWPCYSKQGADAATNSNLFLGMAGSNAMLGYIQDPGISTLGHRRWLLDPGAMEFGSGSTDTTNALEVIGSYGDSSRLKAVGGKNLVAWPAPGWFPSPWIFDKWSVSIGGHGGGVDLSKAKVTASIDGSNLPISGVKALPDGSGIGETLSWNADLPASESTGDHVIEVTVSGVKIKGDNESFSYDVRDFDPDQQVDAPDTAPGTGVTNSGTGVTNSGNGNSNAGCRNATNRLKRNRHALAKARRHGRKPAVTRAKRSLRASTKLRARVCR